MFDDLFNACLLMLIGAIGAATAASALDAAAGTPPATPIARTDIVALPAVAVIGRRSSIAHDLALASAR